MRGRLMVFVLALCLLLTGCAGAGLPYAREMGDMALLRTMAVDAGEGPEELLVTVSTGERTKGLQGEKQPPLILSARRGSLSGACLALQGLSDSYVFYGYVDQLLLGEGMALKGIKPVLEYFAQDVELGLGAQLWLVKGGTGEQAVRAGSETGVDSRLTTLQTDSEMGAGGITRTAGEVFSDLLEDGAAYLPALIPAQEEQSTLLEQGYGVLKDGALAGWLEGDQARGLELLAGRAAADIVEVDVAGAHVAVRVKDAVTRCVPQFDGGRLSRVELYCQITAQVEESSRDLDPALLEQVGRGVETVERRRMEQALAQLQSCVRWACPVRTSGPSCRPTGRPSLPGHSCQCLFR